MSLNGYEGGAGFERRLIYENIHQFKDEKNIQDFRNPSKKYQST